MSVQDEILSLSLADRIHKIPRDADTPKELRVLLVADLYCRGLRQREIAEYIGVSASLVSKDIAEIREAWLRGQVDSFDQRVANELAKIDHLEREAWAAFYRSSGKMETKTERAVDEDGEDGGKSKREVQVREEFHAGNPRFLDIADKCIGRRIDLLGLKAPSRQQISMKIESKIDALAEVYGVDPEEIRQAASQMKNIIDVE